MKILAAILSFLPLAAANAGENCSANLNAVSAELQILVTEDQADRKPPYDQVDWPSVSKRDLNRRQRVAALFAEFGFQTAGDYEAAALIYQHGNVADHYYQAFVWANKADALETSKHRKWLTAAALDRYLVEIGHRQLFGTQMQRGPDGVWCYPGVQPNFPEAKRLEYVRFTVREQIERILKSTGSTMPADQVGECEPKLKATPRGFVPGFW